MAKRKPSDRAAVKEAADDLVTKRRVRRRRVGDGEGIDVGIAGGFFGTGLEKHLAALKPETRKRMHDHIQHHVDEALRPMVKLVSRDGDDMDLLMLRDVGPNLFRTILEFLEDDVK